MSGQIHYEAEPFANKDGRKSENRHKYTVESPLFVEDQCSWLWHLAITQELTFPRTYIKAFV